MYGISSSQRRSKWTSCLPSMRSGELIPSGRRACSRRREVTAKTEGFRLLLTFGTAGLFPPHETAVIGRVWTCLERARSRWRQASKLGWPWWFEDLEELMEVEIACMGGRNWWQTDRRSSDNHSGRTAVEKDVGNRRKKSGLQSGQRRVNGSSGQVRGSVLTRLKVEGDDVIADVMMMCKRPKRRRPRLTWRVLTVLTGDLQNAPLSSSLITKYAIIHPELHFDP